MERQPQASDARLVRAARSLYHNQQTKETAEARIERASEALTSYLGLAGLAAARLGSFDVLLVDGQVHVTKQLPEHDAQQLALPDMAAPEHHVHETALPLATYGLPRHRPPLAGAATPTASQVSFLAPDEAALMHELRQLTVRAAAIYDHARPGETPAESGVLLTSGAEVYTYLRPAMAHLPQEQLRVLTLTLKNQLITDWLVYQGTINASPVRVAEVFRPAIVDSAARVIIAHNHPSGDPAPSHDDIAITRKLAQAGDLFDIELLDHVIVARHGFASMRDRGHLR